MREGRVPRVLHAHSQIAAGCTLRMESTCAHDGEQARADRTRHAEAGGSPSCSRCAKDLERAALKGFPNPPAFWLRRAKPGFANATRRVFESGQVGDGGLRAQFFEHMEAAVAAR